MAISDIEDNRSALETAFFNPSESAVSLASRTLAGFLCVKKAIVAAANFTDKNIGCAEKDILVGHDDLGAPGILDMPKAVADRLGKICVSVSHTADNACGCAVIGEDKPDD